MTNNEAIGILAIVVETARGRCFVTDEAILDAYNIAIKALKAQEKSQEVSNNSPELDKENGELISRQAAIDYCHQLINVEHQQGSDEMNYGQERVNQTETILHHLEFMPSEQPQRMRAKWIVTTSLQEGQITWRDYKCSNCSHHKGKPMHFCEVCGAKMER